MIFLVKHFSLAFVSTATQLQLGWGLGLRFDLNVPRNFVPKQLVGT